MNLHTSAALLVSFRPHYIYPRVDLNIPPSLTKCLKGMVPIIYSIRQQNVVVWFTALCSPLRCREKVRKLPGPNDHRCFQTVCARERVGKALVEQIVYSSRYDLYLLSR